VSVHDADPEAADELPLVPVVDDEDVLVDVLAAPEDDVPELQAAAMAPMPSTPNALSAWRRSSNLDGCSAMFGP
jgi:hypothetical protein